MTALPEATFMAIAADRESGAAELAERGLDLAAAVAAAAPSAAEARARAAAVALRLAEVRPAMAPLGNWAAAFHSDLVAALGRGETPADAARSVRAEVGGRKRAVVEAVVATAREALAEARVVVTLGYSSTVAESLAALPGCRAVVAEARPGLEGRHLCQRLLAGGGFVTCITDAALALAAADADAVIIGADAIAPDGSAVNKTGSRLAALAAADARIPFYVLADGFKLDLRGHPTVEVMAPGEVWPEHPELCRNVPFETVPARLITAHLTDEGCVLPSAIGARAEALRTLWAAVTADTGLAERPDDDEDEPRE